MSFDLDAPTNLDFVDFYLRLLHVELHKGLDRIKIEKKQKEALKAIKFLATELSKTSLADKKTMPIPPNAIAMSCVFNAIQILAFRNEAHGGDE